MNELLRLEEDTDYEEMLLCAEAARLWEGESGEGKEEINNGYLQD